MFAVVTGVLCAVGFAVGAAAGVVNWSKVAQPVARRGGGQGGGGVIVVAAVVVALVAATVMVDEVGRLLGWPVVCAGAGFVVGWLVNAGRFSARAARARRNVERPRGG